MASVLDYAARKVLSSALRGGVNFVDGPPDPHPDLVLDIPSRDNGRTVKAHVYSPPKSPLQPRPVLINFHGSGWVLPRHGENDPYCRAIASQTPYTVIDATYRLAPEHPFPAALNDVADVITWVLSQPNVYDTANVVLSGFSAGANMALVASSVLFPDQTFTHLIAFYPICDFGIADRGSPDPAISPALSPMVLTWLSSNYTQDRALDKRDPRLSPYYAQTQAFPQKVLLVVGGADSLSVDADALAAKLTNDNSGRTLVYRKFDGCDHAWDTKPRIPPGSVQDGAKREAYQAAVDFLRQK